MYQLYHQIQRAHVQNIFYNYLLYPKYSIGGAQLYRQIQRAHVQNIFYNYLLYPKYSIGGARPHEAGTLSPMSQPS